MDTVMTPPQPGAISLAEYAAHRKALGLSGQTTTAARKHINKGHLDVCVVRDARGTPWITDAALADREWARRADYTDAPQRLAPETRPAVEAPSAPGIEPTARNNMSLSEAKEVEAYWKAKEAERKHREAIGELVPAAEVEREWADILSQVRTKLLGIPSQVKQAIPTLSVPEIAAIEGMVRAALEDLARG